MVPLKDGTIKNEHILAELGEVVAGKKIRQSGDDITLFKSVGNAVQDVTVGLAVYRNAVKLGLGIEVGSPKL